jgi:hypothetical protein
MQVSQSNALQPAISGSPFGTPALPATPTDNKWSSW